MKKKIVIALTGMPGVGKSEAAKFFRRQGFPVINLGSVVLHMLDENNLTYTERNEHRFREKLRREFGMAACAIKIYPQIKTELKKNNVVVLDGMRSWEEYIFLNEKLKNLSILAILANKDTRYRRLNKRRERKLDKASAHNRDMKEITKLNICPTILFADIYVVNEGTLIDFQNKLRKLVKKFHEKV